MKDELKWYLSNILLRLGFKLFVTRMCNLICWKHDAITKVLTGADDMSAIEINFIHLNIDIGISIQEGLKKKSARGGGGSWPQTSRPPPHNFKWNSPYTRKCGHWEFLLFLWFIATTASGLSIQGSGLSTINGSTAAGYTKAGLGCTEQSLSWGAKQ